MKKEDRPATVILASEKVVVQKVPVKREVIEEKPSETKVILGVNYDAPESKYDDAAAEFLYKAGESYFSANDFENAIPCFNKLKADPRYPRSKYMFALSLTSMGNCIEASKEYKDFAKVYNKDDARTLEVIFASHFERCKMEGRLVQKLSPEEVAKQEVKDKILTTPVRIYKVQFIAMYKSNLVFPRVATIGNISTEQYPNRKLYRYTLGDYTDIKSAVSDMYKVKKLGFRDAFIAEYEGDIRINTLYHAQ